MQLSVPVKVTAGEEIEKKQYQSLLNVNGEQLPDPFTDQYIYELKENWIGEEKGVEKWPPILDLTAAYRYKWQNLS